MYKLIYCCGLSTSTCVMGIFDSYAAAKERMIHLLDNLCIGQGARFEIV